MVIFDLLSCLTQKKNYSLNILVTQTHYVPELQELLLIMLLWENIVFVSSSEKNSNIHADYIQSKLDGIFFTNVGDIIIIGTQDKIQLGTLHPSWNSTAIHSLWGKVSLS